MKRLICLLLILLVLISPVLADEPKPGPIYLPIILQGGGDMPCGPFQVLEISDGTTTVNLLSPKSGFCLLEWEPALAEPKGGGVWKDSQLAEGRTLAMRKRANAVDTLVLAVRDWTPDDLVRDTQDLRRLLEKAYAYDVTSWQDEPVWVKRQPINATNAEYTIVKDYRTPQDGNPHGSDTFWTGLARAGFPEFVLVLEHEPWWRADQPGTGTCVQTSGQQADWEYDVWQVNTPLPVGDVTEFLDASCGNMLACDSDAAAWDIWRTANGTVWNASVTTPTVRPLSLVDASDGFIYAGCLGQIWRSGDCGVNWVQRNAAVGVNTNNSICEHTDGYLYIVTGALSAEIRRSNDGGATWPSVYQGPPTPTAIISASDGYLYAIASRFDGVFILRSQNGTTWTQVFNVQRTSEAPAMIRELDDGYIYAGSRNSVLPAPLYGAYVYRSANGTDWGQIRHFPLTGYPDAIVHASDGYYYLLLTNGYVYKSPNAYDWVWVVDIGGAAGTNADLIEYSGNNRVYAGEAGDIWWGPPAPVTLGRAATCNDEVYVANKRNVAQLTNIWVYSSAPSWTAQFPAGAFPYQLLPNPMANNDAVYFGIDQNVWDGGPFSSLVLDIVVPASGDFDLTWQYSDGVAGWPGLNVQDGTSAFMATGVNSVHWVPPSDWAVENVNGVTALWVRAIISNVVGNPVGPQQDNRDPYTVNWPRVDVDELQVAGDIPALMQFKFRNRSDEDGYAVVDELDLLENRVVVGLRSLDRGPTFTAYLNCSDEQNPPGFLVTDGANTSDVNDIEHPTGRAMRHNTTGASTWTDECTFTLDPVIASDFYGSHHAYFRGQQENRDAEMDEVRVRLQVRTGSGGVTFTTEHRPFRNLNDWQLLDFGGVDIPASGLFSSSDLGDETELVVQVWSSVASLKVRLYDLILIPTDEWALDAVDKALEDDSGVANGYFLDADSVTYPKRDIRALVRQTGSDLIRSVYQTNTPGPAMLQANADQRLWFLTARGCVLGTHTGANNQPVLTDSAASFLTSGVAAGQYVYNVNDTVWGIVTAATATTVTATTLAGAAFDWDTGEEYLVICPNWRSEPWNCHSVRAWANARYLSMRGAR